MKMVSKNTLFPGMELSPMEFFIPGDTPSSKNSKRWMGKGRGLHSSEYTMNWIKSSAIFWGLQRNKFLEAIKGLPYPLYLEFTFIRKTKGRFDYHNIVQAPLDEMQTHGWIPDDDSLHVKSYFGDHMYDKTNPGVIIKILKQKPNHGS